MSTICKGCGKKIIPNVDPRYTGREPEEYWHWDCHEAVKEKYESTRSEIPAAIERLDNALARLRSVMRRAKERGQSYPRSRRKD